MTYNVPLNAETLRNYRKIKGLTRKEMAAKTGLSESYLYNAEKEITPILTHPERTLREKLELSDAELIKFEALAAAIDG